MLCLPRWSLACNSRAVLDARGNVNLVAVTVVVQRLAGHDLHVGGHAHDAVPVEAHRGERACAKGSGRQSAQHSTRLVPRRSSCSARRTGDVGAVPALVRQFARLVRRHGGRVDVGLEVGMVSLAERERATKDKA